MATNVGIWIDQKQATIVLLSDAGQEIKKVKSSIERAVGVVSFSKSKHTRNDFIAEDRRDRKLLDVRNKLFRDVFAFIGGADALLIVGPGDSKVEFSKQIRAKKLKGLTIALETTDKMTDRQLAAKVRTHFERSPARKLSTPKKAIKFKLGNRVQKK